MTTLLIDADITAFTSAHSQEVATETKDGYWEWHCKFDDVLRSFNSRIDEFMSILNADKYLLFLSDEKNFRKGVYPQYKALRERKKRPVILKHFKEYLIKERQAITLPNLEGDDTIGIYATNGSVTDETIIVSEDKDLKTIPGYLYKGGEVKWYSKEDANFWHLYQTLIGDQTDGYPGCKGIGPKKAQEALQKSPTWETVVKFFEANEQTEEDALVQARCARILHSGDWDAERQEVRLWTPTTYSS